MTSRSPRTQLRRTLVGVAGVHGFVLVALMASNAGTYGRGDWALISVAVTTLATAVALGMRRIGNLPGDATLEQARPVQRVTGGSVLAASLVCLFAFAAPAVREALSITGL